MRVPGLAQPFPYLDPSLSPQERAKDLVGRLTLDQKASLMLDESAAVPQLGIKKFNWWSEALHGLANNVRGAASSDDSNGPSIPSSSPRKASRSPTDDHPRRGQGSAWNGARYASGRQMEFGIVRFAPDGNGRGVLP